MAEDAEMKTEVAAEAPAPAPVKEEIDHMTALQRVLRMVRPLVAFHLTAQSPRRAENVGFGVSPS